MRWLVVCAIGGLRRWSDFFLLRKQFIQNVTLQFIHLSSSLSSNGIRRFPFSPFRKLRRLLKTARKIGRVSLRVLVFRSGGRWLAIAVNPH
jgi:hypothetical protein